jgi:hypothetical protein
MNKRSFNRWVEKSSLVSLGVWFLILGLGILDQGFRRTISLGTSTAIFSIGQIYLIGTCMAVGGILCLFLSYKQWLKERRRGV